MIRKIAVLMLLLMSTGCQNVRKSLFPTDADNKGTHTDPSSVCRASAIAFIWDATYTNGHQLSDDVKQMTGETNGEDGATESVTLCKRDISNNLVGCQTVNNTGMLSDGTMIEYSAGNIEVKLAASNGYAQVKMTINYTCHG